MEAVLAGIEAFRRLCGVVAEGEEEAVGVPVEVRVDHRAFR